ncbi:MAG: hypothetical protein I8H91_02930 [Burkholderiales bacterium]|nr:hypothetical protein [Burkholderiales bacterium]
MSHFPDVRLLAAFHEPSCFATNRTELAAHPATIVNTTLPAMARSFGESPLRMQSVVVAYSLTMAMLIPASGWLIENPEVSGHG